MPKTHRKPNTDKPSKTKRLPKKNRQGRPAFDIDEESLKATLHAHGGIIAKVARAFGVETASIYYRIEKFNLHAYLDEVRDRNLDKAMETVIDNLDDLATAKWFIDHVQRKRVQSGAIAIQLGANSADSSIVIEVKSREEERLLNKFIDNNNTEDIEPDGED